MTTSPKFSILVTGGLGFIGSHIVERLKNKFKIIVVDIDTSQNANALADQWRQDGIQVYQNDISDSNTWKQIEGCDFVFHGAAQTSAEESKKRDVILQDFDTNLRGTFLVAEFARKNNSKVIYCNTIRAYAPEYVDEAIKSNKLIDESFPPVIESKFAQPPFALSKYFGEQYLKLYSNYHKIKVISHRMSGVMGPGQIGKEIHGWVSYIVRCAISGKRYKIFGDGKQSRDILHVKDFVDLITMELNDFDKFCINNFTVYNIGGGDKNVISINDIVKLLKNEHNYSLKFSKTNPRIGEPKYYISCLDKIAKKGWPRENHVLSKEKIVAELVQWYNGGRNETG